AKLQEKEHSLAANEPFQGRGFSFAFPVACDVSQSFVADCEALTIKPKFNFLEKTKETMLVVSTFPMEEIKGKVGAKIQTVTALVKPLETSAFSPMQVGALNGERQTLSATKDGQELRGESVFLGGDGYSIAWFAFGPVNEFEPTVAKYREL